MSKSNLYHFLATLLIFSIAFNDAIVFKFSNAVCKSYNESWVVFNKCRLKAISRDKIVLNVYTMVVYPASSIDVRLKLWKRESGFKPFLLDSTVDACRFMKKAYNPFVGLVYTIFRDFSNLNHSCPYVGLQIVKDFYLRPELVRLPFPSGEYLLSMQWYFYKRIQFDINVTYVYLEDLLHRT